MRGADREDPPQTPEKHFDLRGRLQWVAKKFGAVALVAAAPSGLYGLTHAEVHDYLGTITTTSEGQSYIDLGLLGKATVPLSFGDIGGNVDVEGIPMPPNNDGVEPSSLLDPAVALNYVEAFHDLNPGFRNIKEELLKDALKKSIMPELAIVALLCLMGVIIDPEIRKKIHFSPSLVMGILACELAVVGTIVTAPSHSPPSPDSVLHIFDGTPLEGTTASEPLNTIINVAGPKIAELYNQQKTISETFTTSVIDKFAAKKDLIAIPKPGEEMVSLYSDMHDSITMTAIWTYVNSLHQPNAEIDNGDSVNFGSAFEAWSIRDQAAMSTAPQGVAPGNHDSAVTIDQFRMYGMKVLEGKTVDIGPLSVLGDSDPNLTMPLSDQDVLRRDETALQTGGRILREALESHPDSIALHESTQTKRIISYLKQHHKYFTSLVSWGHGHVLHAPRIIQNSDGTWTVAIQLGTAGGYAPGSLSNFNTPLSTPSTNASKVNVFIDKATGLVSGWQVLEVTPEGEPLIQPRVDVGPINSSPGPIVSAEQPPEHGPISRSKQRAPKTIAPTHVSPHSKR